MILTRDAVQVPNLKWRCMDVSLRYLACGTSSGSIYLYRRRGGSGPDRHTIEHVDTATTHSTSNTGAPSVEQCQFSPDERMLAVALSSGAVVIIALHLDDARRKPQVTQKCMPQKDHCATTFFWSRSSTTLYVGTTGGLVLSLPTKQQSTSNLAKLQSLVAGTKLRVVCALDSEIIQLETNAKSDEEGEIIASTLTRCYVVPRGGVSGGGGGTGDGSSGGNTAGGKTAGGTGTAAAAAAATAAAAAAAAGGKEESAAKRIGEKKRNGRYGACFCSTTDPASRVAHEQLSSQEKDEGDQLLSPPVLVYAARPGKRIWLANVTDQRVLVTLKLKNKFPTSSSSFWGRERPIVSSTTTTAAAAAAATGGGASKEFSKLARFRTDNEAGDSGDLLMCWNTHSISFISTDISTPDNVRVVQTYNELGKILQIVTTKSKTTWLIA